MEIEDNIFTENEAFINGGAIYYDLYSPIGLLDNSYTLNRAKYGKDYASYPFMLKVMDRIDDGSF